MGTGKIPEPARRLGDFEIVRELGRGGMGIVYEAQQISLNRRVALKLLGPGRGLTTRAVDRFHREAVAAAKLHHTNIVPVYATGEEGGIHFYTMELIDGPSLDAVIHQLRGGDSASNTQTEIPPDLATTGEYVPATNTPRQPGTITFGYSSGERFDRAAGMIADVADALHHAHQQGVIHRDIKPSNLLMSSDGRLSITDFGLARMLEQPGITVTGEFVGTPAYMSPEQITAGRIPIDHRTDIYSLGATFYELLTLRPPFSAEGRDKLLAMVIQKEPKAPRWTDPKIPRDLETICLKCLEKDPDRRYQSAKDLEDDLRRFVNRFAILARRAGVSTKIKKWAKRNPAVAVVVLVMWLAVGAAGFFAWQAHEVNQRRLADERTREEELLAEKRKAAIERGMTAAMASDLTAAERAVEEAEMLGASVGETRLLRGFINLYAGRSSEAVAHLEQSVRLMPESVAAQALLARTYMSVGDWQAGTHALDAALALPIRTPEDKLFLGLSLGFFSSENINLVNQALAERPSVLGHVLRADLRGTLAHHSGSIADAEAAVAEAELAKRLLPDNPFSLDLAAFAHLFAEAAYSNDGQQQRAKEHLAAACREADRLAGFPGNYKAITTRHYVAMTRDGLAGKEDFLEEIRQLRLSSPMPGNAYHEAYNLLCRGMDEEAGKVANLFPVERLNAHIRFLVSINRPDGRDEARAIWKAISGPDRLTSFRVEAAPLQFLVDSPVEVAIAARQLRGNGDWLRYTLLKPEEMDVQLAFLEGVAHEDELLGLKVSNNQVSRSRLYTAAAWKRLGAGDRSGAHEMFQKAYDLRTYGSFSWSLARAVLIRMNRDPKWPGAIAVAKR